MVSPKSPSPAKAGPAAAPKAAKVDPGLSERRRFVRTLPVPEVVESDGDTDWAAFQELVQDGAASPPPKAAAPKVPGSPD